VADFDFGPQFKKGGALVGLWSWTREAGDGLDDVLVAVSSAGDVVAYQGTDPADYTQISLKGVNYVGAVPAGRRIALDIGGELVILSSLGIVPASRLFGTGGVVTDDAYLTRKISPVLGRELSDRGTSYGWDLKVHPEAKTLVVMTPSDGSGQREQWVLSLNGQGWAQHLGVPMACLEPWKGKLYFGDEDGRVCINDGHVDNAELGGTANAVAIEASLLTGFESQGTPQLKRPSMARPTFMTTGTVPQWTTEARFDYDRSEIGSVPFVASAAAGVWGTAIWGVDVWGSGVGTAGSWRGLNGAGSSVAIALKVSSVAEVTLTGLEVTFTQASRVA
jgi:hypothetical protein